MNKTGRKIWFYVILTIVAAVWLLPLVMLVLSAIRSTSDFYAKLNLFSIPEKIQWSNFKDAWTVRKSGKISVQRHTDMSDKRCLLAC